MLPTLLPRALADHGRYHYSAITERTDFDGTGEAALIAEARDRLGEAFGETPSGWLGPWIAQSYVTPDLLDEAGFTYHLQLVP